jgi:uncharacterized lipoprotein NlpE involved in copper resistance
MKYKDGIIAMIVIILILTGCSLNKDPVKDWIQIDISETNDLSSAFPKILGSLKTKEQFGTFKNALQSAAKIEGSLRIARFSDYDFILTTKNNTKQVYKLWVKDSSAMYIDMAQGTSTGYTLTAQGKEDILALLSEVGIVTH